MIPRESWPTRWAYSNVLEHFKALRLRRAAGRKLAPAERGSPDPQHVKVGRRAGFIPTSWNNLRRCGSGEPRAGSLRQRSADLLIRSTSKLADALGLFDVLEHFGRCKSCRVTTLN
jgi:hypothetical protein